MKVIIPQHFKDLYFKQGYRMVGRHGHSACKICHWTKKSLVGKGTCYKQKWYGISSHRCLQCTPSLYVCTQKCQFCWRSIEATIGTDMKDFLVDEPSEIVNGLIQAQRELLSGFGGNPSVPKWKFKEAQNPTNAAISLAGEPTLYPHLSELIAEFHRRNFTTFLVTNGTRPDRLEGLETEPTQLYITIAAPDKETYQRTCQPLIANGWERLNESLELMPTFECRKVIRLTLVKGLNMKYPERYAKLIAKTNCDFIEAKAYMFIGESRKRLKEENMPSIEDVREFAKRLSKLTGYAVKDESPPSRVVLLSKS